LPTGLQLPPPPADLNRNFCVWLLNFARVATGTRHAPYCSGKGFSPVYKNNLEMSWIWLAKDMPPDRLESGVSATLLFFVTYEVSPKTLKPAQRPDAGDFCRFGTADIAHVTVLPE